MKNEVKDFTQSEIITMYEHVVQNAAGCVDLAKTNEANRQRAKIERFEEQSTDR